MIYAQFNFIDDQYTKFTLSGHAESGPYGHDLVCAAVSALTISAANNLTRIASIKPDVDANQEDGGYLEVGLPVDVDVNQQETAQILLRSLHYSLLDIQEEYREYLSVSKIDIN